MGVHYRYDSAPARHPGARPEPAQRTAGVLPVHWPELRLLAWVVSAAKTKKKKLGRLKKPRLPSALGLSGAC
eukprot:scaffold8499_cov99-Isochrysis_galbana.AAC.1